MQNNAQIMQNRDDVNDQERDSDTFRESQCIPGSDPNDINQGCRFIFLKKEATAKMRKDKKKVRYIFEGEVDNQGPDNPLIDSESRVDLKKIECDPRRIGSSGQAPEQLSSQPEQAANGR